MVTCQLFHPVELEVKGSHSTARLDSTGHYEIDIAHGPGCVGPCMPLSWPGLLEVYVSAFSLFRQVLVIN